MKELEGRVAVVTGAARGIGEAIAGRLAEMGATVVLTARDADKLAAIQQKMEASGGKAESVPCDLLDSRAVSALGERVEKTYGRCDILVNNAGVGGVSKPLHELSAEEWDVLMGTNLRGPFLTIKTFAPLMIRAQRGDIVNISSLAGKNPLAMARRTRLRSGG